MWACACLQLFFAKVLRSASEDEVKELFTRFGSVYDVNLFRAFQGAPTTKVWHVGLLFSELIDSTHEITSTPCMR